MSSCCAMLSALTLVWTGQVRVWNIPPTDGELVLPKAVTITGSVWEDVRENQEIFAREFDALLKRLDPALAARGANYTEETDEALRADIAAAGLSSNVAPDVLEQRIDALLLRHTDPYERGQILFEGGPVLELANDRERAAEIIAEALKLPLWPDQRVELYRVRGQIIITLDRLKRQADSPDEDTTFPERRRKLAREYLSGIKVALDCDFPRDLPDLQRSNTLEKYTVPDDPAKHQAILKQIAYRKTIEAKALKFLGMLTVTENMKASFESRIVSQYAKTPHNPEELAALAAEILHDPQEEAKLMRMLKARG